MSNMILTPQNEEGISLNNCVMTYFLDSPEIIIENEITVRIK